MKKFLFKCRYSFPLVFCFIILLISSCNNKSKEIGSKVDSIQNKKQANEFEWFSPKDSIKKDSLKKGKTFNNSGAIIFCYSNNSEYAGLYSDKYLSEDEINSFIKDNKVPSSKKISFSYTDLKNISSFATVSNGVITYNKKIPSSYSKAKQLSQQIEVKKKQEEIANRKTIVGEWLNAGAVLCIYKQRGKYYIGMVNGDNDEISELYEVVRVSSKRYENRDNGDMPERFNIIKNGDIESFAYNPDAPGGGRWVYMGTWMSLNN